MSASGPSGPLVFYEIRKILTLIYVSIASGPGYFMHLMHVLPSSDKLSSKPCNGHKRVWHSLFYVLALL